MARKSKKATASYARREKHRAYGEPLPLAHYVQIPVDQSIKEYLSTLGPDCVAFERYADGTLYFSGNVSPAQCEQLSITPKPGWKPEVRRSRTLSLLIKGLDTEHIPALSTLDALSVVQQSTLWPDSKYIELIRVANTNKSNHIFVQFEGEVMARRHINVVDAMRLTHPETHSSCIVHGSQLNKYYEYEPEHESEDASPSDPLIWYNEAYVGRRSFTLRFTANEADATILHLIETVLQDKLCQSMDSVRRIQMDQSGVHAVIAMLSEEAAITAFNLFAALHQENRLIGVTDVTRLSSRQYDSEASDTMIWSRSGEVMLQKSVATFSSFKTESGSKNEGEGAGGAGAGAAGGVGGNGEVGTPRSVSENSAQDSFDSTEVLTTIGDEPESRPTIEWNPHTTTSGYDTDMFQFFYQ